MRLNSLFVTLIICIVFIRICGCVCSTCTFSQRGFQDKGERNVLSLKHDSICDTCRCKTTFSNEATDHKIFLGGSQEQRLLAYCESGLAAPSTKCLIHEPLLDLDGNLFLCFDTRKLENTSCAFGFSSKFLVSSFCRLNTCTLDRWIQKLWTL